MKEKGEKKVKFSRTLLQERATNDSESEREKRQTGRKGGEEDDEKIDRNSR